MSRSYGKQIRAIIFIVVFAVVAAFGLLFVTRPYALTADGHRTYEAYEVKAGDSSIAYVQTEKEGNEVIRNIKKSYYKGDSEPKDLEVSPAITVEKRELERNEPIQLQEPEDAARDLVTSDKNAANPTVTVSYTATKEDTKKIKFKTVYKKTAELKKGETKVAKKGKTGKKVITSRIEYENGKAVKKVIVSKTVAKKAESRVVYQGTKVEKKKHADKNKVKAVKKNKIRKKTAGKRSIRGQKVVDYACQFIGNPYVYGGSSLTNGTDCSGFVMSVYAHFGIELPHSSAALASCGTAVSYSNAVPGDVFCYPGHVGIYIGNGKIVHASCPQTGIIIGDAFYTSPTTIRHIN